jgi:hypothetical protein
MADLTAETWCTVHYKADVLDLCCSVRFGNQHLIDKKCTTGGCHPRMFGDGVSALSASELHSVSVSFNERFIAPINIKTYMIVTKLFFNYNQFTTVS